MGAGGAEEGGLVEAFELAMVGGLWCVGCVCLRTSYVVPAVVIMEGQQRCCPRLVIKI